MTATDPPADAWLPQGFPVATPRTVRVKPDRRRQRNVLIGVMLGFWAFFLVFALPDLWRQEQLRERGQRGEAVVLNKDVQRGKSSWVYRVEFAFARPGYVDREWAPVGGNLFDRATVGEEIPITYLPDQPETHRLGAVSAASVREAARLTILGTLVCGFIPGVLLLGVQGQQRREFKLLRDGIVTRATILDHEIGRTRQGGQFHRFRYEFMTESGEVRNWIEMASPDLRVMQVGSVVPCLYVPGDVYESSLLDSLSQVEVVR